jgi:hypothetical protein
VLNKFSKFSLKIPRICSNMLWIYSNICLSNEHEAYRIDETDKWPGRMSGRMNKPDLEVMWPGVAWAAGDSVRFFEASCTSRSKLSVSHGYMIGRHSHTARGSRSRLVKDHRHCFSTAANSALVWRKSRFILSHFEIYVTSLFHKVCNIWDFFRSNCLSHSQFNRIKWTWKGTSICVIYYAGKLRG